MEVKMMMEQWIMEVKRTKTPEGMMMMNQELMEKMELERMMEKRKMVRKMKIMMMEK